MSSLTKTAQATIWQRISHRTHHGDRLFWIMTLLCSFVLVGMIIAIGFVTFRGSEVARKQFGWGFLTSQVWQTTHPEAFGALPAIYGTLTSSLIAVVLAAPIGIGTGIYLAEICPRLLRMPLSLLVELLAAIPSVIYGLWGVVIFAPLFRDYVAFPISETIGRVIPQLAGPVSMGRGIMLAGVVIGIMILPTIAAITRDVVAAVPNSQREVMYALGATPWDVIWRAILPYSFAGIFGGIMLGLGRALGETMAAVMLIGNNIAIHTSLFAPGVTAASLIANQLPTSNSVLHESALVYLALTLFGITFVVNLFARLLVWHITRERT